MQPFFKKYLSPAKVNLFLKVLSKREDGFHNLCSLMQAVNIFDEIFIEFSDVDSLICSNKKLLTDSNNFIVKAIKLFKKEVKSDFHLNIFLKKNIPISAGLGGGSSNVATILWALNELLETNLSINDLQVLASKISSDAPFFFSYGRAVCEGRGELVKNEKNSENFSFYLIKPNFGSSTKKVYENLNLSGLKNVSTDFLLKSFKNFENPFFHNDLEKSAFLIEPKLFDIKTKLCKYFSSVMLTGSGSSFICTSRNENLENLENFQIFKINNVKRNENSWYS